MPTNYGLLREDEMVAHLDGKKIKSLSNNLRNLIRDLYGVLDENGVVHCVKTQDYIKPDFIITYKRKKRYVSMKSGRCEIVHQEIVKNFVLFLRSLGVSNRTQQTILLYHYGDGTMDGSAPKRIEYEKLRVLLHDRIKEANEELNKNKDFIMAVMDHCLFKGTIEGAEPADCIYHGDYEFGVVATRKQIEKHIHRKEWNYINNLHIGPLQLRPHARYIGKEIKSQKKREALECYWPHLGADIDWISHRYDF